MDPKHLEAGANPDLHKMFGCSRSLSLVHHTCTCWMKGVKSPTATCTQNNHTGQHEVNLPCPKIACQSGSCKEKGMCVCGGRGGGTSHSTYYVLLYSFSATLFHFLTRNSWTCVQYYTKWSRYIWVCFIGYKTISRKKLNMGTVFAKKDP